MYGRVSVLGGGVGQKCVGKHDSGWSKFVTVSEFPSLPLMFKSYQPAMLGVTIEM